MLPTLRVPALCAALTLGLTACPPPPPAPPPGPPPPAAEDPDAHKDPGAQKETLPMADDVPARLARFSPTPIDFDEALVPPEHRPVLVKLVQAAQVLDDIFLDQVHPQNRTWRAQLVAQKAPPEVITYFDIMYGPWDRLNHDEPFVGTTPKPPGAGFYPLDLTKEELEGWIKAHPEQEAAFTGYFTVIRREGDKLVAVPYSEAYGERLKKAAALLREGAAVAKHPALKRYLELRADAFLSNDYYESDKAWMDLGDSPIEVVIGPYEVYEDKLMGYKAAFEAFVTLRDPVQSARLQKLARFQKALEANLPLPKKFHTKRGLQSPISVVIEVFTAGDTRAGVQTAAFNLPNDERVRSEKGSKKVLLKNVTEAKFNKALLPIAHRVLADELHPLVTFDAYFTDILLHEMAHGLGPGKIKVNGRDTEVNRELKELYPAIEECKADIVGLVNAQYLIGKKALPEAMRRQIPAAYAAGIFRAVRFGAEEAHARGVLLAFNYLKDRGAIVYDEKAGTYNINFELFYAKVRELAGELLMVQAKGSYDGAKKLLDTYGVVRPEMKAALDKLKDVPVDIRPEYAILEKMKGW